MKKTLIILMCLVTSQLSFSQTSSFIENKGQIIDQFGKYNQDVLYLFPNGKGLNTQLLKDGFSYDLYSGSSAKNKIEFSRIDIKFEGCNSNIEIIASLAKPSTFNYCKSGINPIVENNVRHYDIITYKNVYNNIDIVFKVSQGSVKYDIILHPGASIDDVKFRYFGIEGFELSKENILSLTTSSRTVRESIPLSYYKESGKEKDVEFVVLNDDKNTLLLGYNLKSSLNPNKTLVIDPVPDYVWGKYIGDSLSTSTTGVITDRYGFVYICGHTQSLTNIATAGAYQVTITDSISDAYLSKYNSGGGLIWSTYFGGEANDIAHDVYVDTSLNVFLAGTTYSLIGITDSLGHQDSLGGDADAFIAKFNVNGGLEWSSYLGGTGEDVGTKLSTDYLQNVYLCGQTQSTSQIAFGNTYQSSLIGQKDGYVAKFDSLGIIQWSTYLGGTSTDEATGVAFGDTSVFISGVTYSNDFSMSANAHQGVLDGNSDGFLVKLTSDGDYVWSTYFGGQNDDNIENVKVFNNNVYFIGTTQSDSSIATLGSFQQFKSDSSDAFISKMDRDGVLLWSSFFGGDSTDLGVDLFFELDSNIIITGTTYSSDLTADSSSYQITNGGASDAFISKITKDGQFLWSSYYGGSEAEDANAVAVYGNTAIYLVGNTLSDSLLLDTNQVNGTNIYNSDTEGFFTKFVQFKSTPPSNCSGGGNFIEDHYYCPGEDILLMVQDGELGTDADWIWYQGGCGVGPVFATGDSIHVAFYTTTTLYVRAESITNSSDCFSITIYIAPDLPINIISDSMSCEGSDYLLQVAGSGSVNWTGPNNFISTAYDSLLSPITLADEGWYYVESVDEYGCFHADSLNLIVNQSPVVSTTFEDVTCFGYSDGEIIVHGDNLDEYEFEWLLLGDPDVTVLGQDSLSNIGAGLYQLMVLDSNNCSYIDSILISGPPSFLIDTTITPTACADSTGTIVLGLDNINGPYSIVWSPTNQTGDTATFLNYGWHEITIVAENKCSETHALFVPNVNDLSVEIISQTQTICAGTPTGSAIVSGVNGTQPYTYDWIDLNVQSEYVSDLDTGVYVVYVYDAAGCYAFDSITINAKYIVDVDVFVVSSLCSEPTGQIVVMVDEPANYSIIFSNGSQDVWILDSLSAGDYTLTVIDTFGCEFQSTYTIDLINDLEIIVLPNDTTLEMGTSTPLNIVSNYLGNLTYVWYPEDYLSCTTCENTIITPMEELTYEVIATDSFGCVDTTYFNFVMTIPCIDIFIPTMFSPNGDNLNDEWSVIGTCISEIEVQVFNQWGQLLFTSTDQSVAWDGKYEGSLVQNDQYTYIVNVTYSNGITEGFSGFLTVAN